MKRYKTILIKGLLLGSLFSCDYGDLNLNPNLPSTAPLSSLLSGSQGVIAFSSGADLAQITNTFTQHLSGIVLQAAAWDRYNVDAEAGGPFNTFYAGPMQDLSTLIRQAQDTKANGYEGIGKILMAYSLGTMTSLYGDIPYSDALKGAVNPYPKFDSQESIYQQIQTLLDEGITLLKSADATNSPGNDDLIYKGNLPKWIAAAYTFKARYALHLSKANPEAASKALAALYDGTTYRGIARTADDCDFNFGTGVTESNPWSQLVQQRNDFRLGKQFVDLLKVTPADPRLPLFAKPNAASSYSGSPAGQGQATDSQIGSYFTTATTPVSLITYAEAKFIEAEARLRVNGTDVQAETALKAAISASVEKVTKGAVPAADLTAFVANRGTFTGDAANRLRQVITQKYIALFTQPEVWTDWRRTGYPALQPAFGGTNGLNPGGEIPRRLPVPLGERLNNPSAPKDNPSVQTPRFYWDK
ncbi:SusD/RagB family nutrient-binding outer membrane lipoprotein [Larkinella bovis]|uniref:SusD/RagB family nutrient-binding outer membrane lipoprotein n=1 Tax=Larkinella bovis TaxID=683041 RepID=A0ABW0IBZ3_9BACT